MGCPSLRLHSTPCAEMPNCSHQVLGQTQVLMQFHSCIVAEDILDPKLILAILWRLPVALRHGLRIESFSWYLYARKCMEKKHEKHKQSQLLGSSQKLPPDSVSPNISQPNFPTTTHPAWVDRSSGFHLA